MDFEHFRQLVLEGGTNLTGEEPPPRGEPTDDALYQAYCDELSGESTRRRAIENAAMSRLSVNTKNALTPRRSATVQFSRFHAMTPSVESCRSTTARRT
jgi:hypothetical protein